MSAESVGQIGLDLVVNKNNFEKQMGGVQKLAAKAGKALAAAFAVKKLISFGNACIELGSDLQEVQNVVDVTFPAMSKRVDEFAQKAATSFGLSETMAKKFTGTFGAMAKAFGFSEKAAYDMSTTLTGLAGDVASFYNITQDEAYTKLKSVFTGETESLKDLGVVMTQTALDSYALANGFGKTTKSMSEAEKVALRYKFVQEQLAGATGDFMRTSDGWANQVRVLNLQFDSLKATIGQGLINLFTPVIKIINTLVGKLMTLANAFKSFTEMVTGKNGTGEATAQMNSTALAADKAAEATKSIGDAAASSAKKMKGLLAFDELNVLSKETGSGSGDAGGGYNVDSFDMGSVDTGAIDNVDKKYSALLDKAKELANLFKNGFKLGIGNTDVFGSIGDSLQGIKERFLDVFTSPEVVGAFDNFVGTLIKNAGVISGSFISIGASIADNLLAGISGYLDSNSGTVKDYIISMFDIRGDLSDIRGNLYSAFATVAESLRSEGAKNLTEALIGAVADAFFGVTQTLGKLSLGLLDVITGPFIENQDKIRISLEDTFSAVAPVFENIKSVVDECVSVLQSAYDNNIGPTLSLLKEGLSEVAGKWLEAYNTYILPVVSELSDKFGEFKKDRLDPLIQKFGEFAGKVSEAVGVFWTNALQPALEKFIEIYAPIIGEAMRGIGQLFMDLGERIFIIANGIMTVFGGLADFISGVFTGDWQKAWNGIKDIFTGIIGTFVLIIKNTLQTILNTAMSILNIAKLSIGNKLNAIKDTFVSIFNGIKDQVSKIFSSLWNDGIKNTINSILSGIESMANGIVRGINSAIESLNKLSFNIPDWIPEIGGKSFGFSISAIPEISIPKLASGAYVKANTPQLAMIGDNRHQGELVAPEDKIYEISAKAMKDVMQQFMSALSAVLNSSQRKDGTVVLKVTGDMAPFVRLLKVELDKEANRAGVDFKVVYE